MLTRDADAGSQARRIVVLSLAMSADDSLPNDIATLKAMLVAERAARIEAEAKARSAEAKAHARALEIEKLKFAIAKLQHQRFGQSAERGALIEQLELQLADLEENAAEALEFAPVVRPKSATERLCHDLNNHDVIALQRATTIPKTSAGARVYAVNPPNTSVSLARTSS